MFSPYKSGRHMEEFKHKKCNGCINNRVTNTVFTELYMAVINYLEKRDREIRNSEDITI